MIVYREFSSLTQDLGFSARTLYSVSNRLSKHYKTAVLPKADGSARTLHIPDSLLKSIQRSIAQNLLAYEPISPYATAYRICASTRKNAMPHIGKPMLLKLDIRGFFDHVDYCMVKQIIFPAERFSEQNRILLSLLCTFSNALPQGAPTSPAISNIILRDFDNDVGAWCKQRGIAYTRYCDDMSFSGSFDARALRAFVQAELKKRGFFLNNHKTKLLRTGQRMTVTGIVVNEKAAIPKAYRRELRQTLHYCKRYGVASHMKRCGISCDTQHYIRQLLGKVNYVLSVSPELRDFRADRQWLQQQLKEQ